MSLLTYGYVCWQLVWCNLVILRQSIMSKVIDRVIWAFISLFVNAYIMPYFGVGNDFGLFQLGGIIAAVGVFEVYANVMDLTLDFKGDRIIDYHFTLPVPSWCVLLSKVIYLSINSFLLALILLPAGKICLWHQLDLGAINYGYFLLALLAQSIFYGSCAIFLASFIEHMYQMRSVWSRCIFPMWFMGGFVFSWKALYSVLPVVAMIDLINPMIYITESTRIAILGQDGYLNYWICLSVIMLFSVVCFMCGVYNLKRRLDFV